MDGRPYENYYTTQTHQRRMESPGPLSRPVASFLQGFDGEHLAMCFVSAIVIYGAGYIIARLFYSGIMFFLAVGLILFFIMQIVDGVDRSVRDYNKVYLLFRTYNKEKDRERRTSATGSTIAMAATILCTC